VDVSLPHDSFSKNYPVRRRFFATKLPLLILPANLGFLPKRNAYSKHFVSKQLATSLVLPALQSRHLARIVFNRKVLPRGFFPKRNGCNSHSVAGHKATSFRLPLQHHRQYFLTASSGLISFSHKLKSQMLLDGAASLSQLAFRKLDNWGRPNISKKILLKTARATHVPDVGKFWISAKNEVFLRFLAMNKEGV
jgi:hypothetical protein